MRNRMTVQKTYKQWSTIENYLQLKSNFCNCRHLNNKSNRENSQPLRDLNNFAFMQDPL